MISCDICGGKLVVMSGGVAVCNDCGMEYSKERLQEKLSFKKQTNHSMDQTEKWIILAEEAYANGNYEEAYPLFCKLLESDPYDWKATYKKGICLARTSTLGDPEIDQAIYGVLDAIAKLEENKIIKDDEYSDIVIGMLYELNSLYFDWSQAAINHVSEFAMDSPYAIMILYTIEMYIAKGLEISLDLINERVCFNHPSIEFLESIMQTIKELVDVTITCLEKQFSCRVGGHITIFDNWKDDYELFSAPDSAVQIKQELISALTEKDKLFEKWLSARKNRINYQDVIVANSLFSEELKKNSEISQLINQRIEKDPEKQNDVEVERFTNFFIPKIMELLNRYDELQYSRGDKTQIESVEIQIKETLSLTNDALNSLIDKFNSEDIMDITAEFEALKGMLQAKGY